MILTEEEIRHCVALPVLPPWDSEAVASRKRSAAAQLAPVIEVMERAGLFKVGYRVALRNDMREALFTVAPSRTVVSAANTRRLEEARNLILARVKTDDTFLAMACDTVIVLGEAVISLHGGDVDRILPPMSGEQVL